MDRKEKALRDLIKAAEELLWAIRMPASESVTKMLALEKAVAKAKEQL